MDIQIFKHEEFGNVRIVMLDGDAWFVGKDVADILGYADTFGALKKHVDDDDKQVCQIDSFASPRGLTVINESGVYSLILRSNLPKAKDFKRWVTAEVLPSIRKHGAYLTPQAAEKILCNPDFIIKLAEQVKQAQMERDQFKALAAAREETIRELQPKADYCALILQSDEAISMRTIADDYGLSAQKFNNYLQTLGIIFKAGKSWLVKQAYRGRGYTIKITTPLKDNHSVTNTYWTQKGRMFLYNVLKKHGLIPVCEREEPMTALL